MVSMTPANYQKGPEQEERPEEEAEEKAEASNPDQPQWYRGENCWLPEKPPVEEVES
jgi:hypothetical protein